MQEPLRPSIERQNYGLVLGGGGARGLAHLGVMRVLEREGLLPRVVAGTSMGGLVGAFIAAGYNAEELQTIAGSLSLRRLLDWRVGTGLLSDRAFRAWMSQHLPPTFEELQLPLAVTATDIISGRLVYLSRGDLYSAIRATIAYPGAIDPVSMHGMVLLDGGILNNVPVDAAVFLGATRTLAVDVTAPEPLELEQPGSFGPLAALSNLSSLSHLTQLPNLLRELRPGQRNTDGHHSGNAQPAHLNALQSLRRSVDIMQAQLTDARLSLYRPDILLRPKLTGIDISNFNRAAQAIEAGQEATEREVVRLHALLGS